MGDWVLRARPEDHSVLSPREVRVEVDGVAVEDGRLADRALEHHVDRFELLDAAHLKVESLLKGLVAEGLAGVECVEHGLLELLQEGLLVQIAQVQPVEVLRAPELSLSQLLLIHEVVCEGHDEQVSLRGEQSAAFRLKKLVTSDNIRLNHSLVEQESSQWLTHYRIDRFERYLFRANIFHFCLDHSNHILEAIVLNQSPCYFRRITRLTSVHFLCTSLGCEQTKNTTTTAHIHDNFALEIGGVLQYRIPVAWRSHRVLQHVLLIGQFRVVTEVLPHSRRVIRVDSPICGGDIIALGLSLLCLFSLLLGCVFVSDGSDLLHAVA